MAIRGYRIVFSPAGADNAACNEFMGIVMAKARDRLIIALDDMDNIAALRLIEETKEYAATYKIGLNLFYRYGSPIIRDIAALGVDIFLDVKLHDIPLQVTKALEVLLPFEPRFITLHALGGSLMLKEAVKLTLGTKTTLLAVTMLTSLDQRAYESLGFNDSVAHGVVRLARLADEAGVRGLVCSAVEASAIKAQLSHEGILVCPGIRGRDEDAADQARTMAVYDAMKAGADFLVVGRPITKAHDVKLAVRRINSEIGEFFRHE